MEKGLHRCLLMAATCLLTIIAGAQDTTQHVIPGRFNSPAQQQKPYVILISADGFRYDYAEKYQAKNLLRLRAKGVTTPAMLPSFPSLTFPNHYTLATGLYPAHHGLVDNKFYDPSRKAFYINSNKRISYDSSWYGGTPLWVLAEQQQMVSASFYWVGSEVAVQGVRPTYSYYYNEQIPFKQRLQVVRDWLALPEEKRPHFISFYFPETDHAGHRYGPDSEETRKAVLFIDSCVGAMAAMADSTGLPVNFVFVSDHGMARVDTEHAIPLPAIDTTQFVVSPGEILVHLYARERSFIKPAYRQLKKQAVGYKVYRSSHTPRYWHYGKKDDRYGRVGDILLVAGYPKIFAGPLHPGRHGYDPRKVSQVKASFIAWGPAIKEGITVPEFENIQIFPLVARLLGLEMPAIDGRANVLNKVLKE